MVSLKMCFKARALMVIAWTPSPPYQCASFDVRVSNACDAATCLAKTNYRRNIVPHGRKGEEWRIYKLWRYNAFVLPPQYSNKGPLTCGPFTCQPPHCHMAPPARPRGPVWPCHAYTPPRHHLRCVGSHGSASWPCVPCRIRTCPAPRRSAVHADKNPFLRF